MLRTSTRFHNQHAPCGLIADGERLQDRDEECLLTDDLSYDCGCRSTSHEYHDGAVSRTVVRHDGAVLVDELLAGE
jgi:hypothetical protein